MLRITRKYRDDSTTGDMTYGDFECKTLELPWLDNQTNISCIPEGIYDCIKTVSGKFGECIAVQGVDGRTYIRIHKGNFTRQILGCVLVGEKSYDFDGDGIPDVTSSAKTLRKLLDVLPVRFQLEVTSC